MTVSMRTLASGDGWRATEAICTNGPGDPVFEERHGVPAVALVVSGGFQYRGTAGRASLAPGALLLGNPGQCYECGHEHGRGDRCLPFLVSSARLEAVAASLKGARRARFSRPSIPADRRFACLAMDAEAAAARGDPGELEEVGLRLAGAALSLDQDLAPAAPAARDERRIARALRRIEAEPEADLSLAELAAEAAMSAYHFLRVFRRLVGSPPHRYLLMTRLRRVAVRLATGETPISTIAFEAGFGDLSTFNRLFKEVTGLGPGAYRARFRRRS